MDKSRDLDKNKKPHKSDSEKKEKTELVKFSLPDEEGDNKATSNQQNKEFTEKDELYKNLLNIREVIRDPIHGDVGITLLEKVLIDNEIFQRMRGLSQLGTTQLVYPGAVHNRFIHSIGTLYFSEKLVEICNHNYEYNCRSENLNRFILKIDPYQHLIIRLSALLHDIAHIPFGHTLVDEGNLFLSQWKDPERLKVFQKGQPIYECIKSVIEKFESVDGSIITENICQGLTDILIKEEYKDQFVVDIVSGTLCADLLDYTQRDLLFCGLSERWADRFIKYFAILSVEKLVSKSKEIREDAYKLKEYDKGGKGRLILLAYRYEQDVDRPQTMKPTRKMEVLSEAIDLLRKRFSLSEKVYFHRTKLAASSMLISAVASSGLNNEELFKMKFGGYQKID
jgi:HD superfamily phosphohydrolase